MLKDKSTLTQIILMGSAKESAILSSKVDTLTIMRFLKDLLQYESI